MKNIILEPKNPDMETMYLFHSFIALHIKFHPEGENEQKMVSFANDNLQHPPPRLSHLLFTRAHITYGHAWKGADAFLSFLYKHMLPWSPSSNLVWVLLPWLLSHTSLLNILLSQLSPKYSFLLNPPSEDTELHTPILGHEKALSSKDGSELLVTQEFSGFREKNLNQCEWWLMLYIVDSRAKTGTILGYGCSRSLTWCWWAWYWQDFWGV